MKLLAKLVTLALCLGLVIVLSIGCTPAPAPEEDGGAPPQEEEEDGGGPAQPEEEVIEWVGQIANPEGSTIHQSFAGMAAKVEDASNGRLVITAHGGGAVTPSTEEQDAINAGILDIAQNATIFWADEYNAAPLFNYRIGGLPGVRMMLWMEQEGHDLLNEMIADTNVFTMPGIAGTPELFLNTTKPLRTVADLKGLKIRTAGDDGVLLTRMGASVVSMPPGDIYEAMQRGVIDAFQLNAPSVDVSTAMYEVCDYTYVSPARQPTDYFSTMLNKDSWNDLPDDLKAIVEACLRQQVWDYLTFATKADAEALVLYQDYGVVVEPAPQAIVDELLAQAAAYYEEKGAADPFYAQVLESQYRFEENFATTYPAGL